MLTTLKNWLRPTRPARHRFAAPLEQLETRDVMDSKYLALNTADLTQDWTNASLSNNNWGSVPSIEGYNGNGLAPGAGKDPTTVLGTGGTVTVRAGLSDPDAASSNTFGIGQFNQGSEFSSDPVVALQGDSTNQAPYLIFYLDNSKRGDIRVNFSVEDLDGSNDNAIELITVQYRFSATGNFTGVPFKNAPTISLAPTTDVTKSPGRLALVNVLATLPGYTGGVQELSDRPFVQVRILTTNATGPGGGDVADEWVGIDDIVIHGNAPPAVTVPATPLVYTENDGVKLLDSSGTVTDLDSPDFNGGALTVDFQSTPTADDFLFVNNQGTLDGQISVVGGNTVRYTDPNGTVTIGTIASGTNGSPPNKLTISLNANANVTNVEALLQNIYYLNPSDDPIGGTQAIPGTNARTVRFTLTDGDGAPAAVVTRELDVVRINDVPLVTFPRGPLTVVEQDPAAVLDPTATVSDPDGNGTTPGVSPHPMTGGSLTVRFSGNVAVPGDILAIQNQGTAAGKISVTGNTVSYGGTAIGTFTGGTYDTTTSTFAPLVVTFNINANADTPPALNPVTALVRAITFQNTSDNPPGGSRQVVFTVNDGYVGADNNGDSTAAAVTVTVTQVDDAPAVARSHAGLTYTENNAATVIDSGFVLTDPDSPDFNTGSVSVSFASGGAAEDRLAVRNQGTGPGQIGVSGATVSYQGTAIGSINGSGFGTTPLQITLNASASQAAVLALLQDITYFNVSDNPSTTPRVVQFVVNDGDGQASTPTTVTVTVVPVDDGPTLSGIGGPTPVSYQAGFPAAVLDADGTVTDPDSADFRTGKLTVTISAAALTADALGIRNLGTGAGRIGTSGTTVTYGGTAIGTFSGGTSNTPLVVVFNSNATPAAVTALTQNITFATPNGSGVGAVDRTVTFQATDDQNVASNSPTVTVHVTSTAQADDDFYTINEDATLTVPSSGNANVLANDGAGAGNATVTTGPAHAASFSLNPNGSFTYVPVANFNGVDTFNYSYTGGSGGSPAQVTIIVQPVNDPPTVVVPPAATVNEDAPAQSLAGFAVIGPGGGADEANQTFTVSISNSNPGLFTTQPAVDGTGKLTFTPAPNKNGTATITLTVQDNGGTTGNVADQDTTAVTFDIVVNAVNDIPSFQIQGTPPTVAEDAGPQAVSGFALNFTPGPATATDEATQTPTYVLTSAGGATLAFAAAPQIDANGVLTYTSAPNSYGTATFSAVAVDGGGTAFGGVDTSVPRTFTITVSPVNDNPTVGADDVTVFWNSDPNPLAVLANDSGAPDVNETVRVSAVSPPGHGTVAVQPGGGGVTYQPTPAFVGTDTFTYTVSDGNGGFSTATVTVHVVRPNTTSADIVALGSGAGGGSLVRVYDSRTGSFAASFNAFDPAFAGAVSVATGDVNGDGVTDIVVGAGVGGGPRVMVIDGNNLALLTSERLVSTPDAIIANFFAYDPNFQGGVNVAVGDVNGDGKADIIVGTGPGGGPNVKVISGARADRYGSDRQIDDSAVLSSFFAYDPLFRGGVNVAAGDVNGDGFADVVTAAGAGGGSHVKVFDGAQVNRVGPGTGAVLASFYAYDAAFRGGVNVAAGDFDGDGRAEIITGSGPGGGGHVKVYTTPNLTLTASFFAFGPAYAGGVDVGYRVRQGKTPLLLASAGAGTDSRVLAFAAPGFTPVANFDAFDPAFLGGVDVG